jgi:predicted Zn-dependent peptidase
LTEPVCPDNRELVKRIKTFSKRKPQVDKTREFEKQLEIQWLESKPDTTAMESLAQRLYQKSTQLSTNFRNSIVYISGNLPDNAEDLVARYIASVQASVVPQNQFSVNVPRLAKGGEAKEFEWNNKKMAKVKYLFTALPQKHFQLKDELMLEAIRQFAVVKMNEIMRDKYGLIYAIGVTGNAQTYPRDFYSFNLRYMLDTASVEKSKKVMLEEVLTPISKGEISKQELEKVKAMVSSYYVMSFYDKKQIGDRWLRWALKYDKIASPKEISKLIDSISLKELQELMKQVVDVENHFVILQNPKVSKEEDKK